MTIEKGSLDATLGELSPSTCICNARLLSLVGEKVGVVVGEEGRVIIAVVQRVPLIALVAQMTVLTTVNAGEAVNMLSRS